MNLEVVTVPVSDVNRAKRFCQGLGWRLDADLTAGDAFGGTIPEPRSLPSPYEGTG
jgi:catechol 2,3-dioxygenase-like lactoylglutathione lyase family enzyme